MSPGPAGDGPSQISPSPGEDFFQEERKRLHCPLYGCKRVYADTDTLNNHVRDHQIHTQSLPGMTFHCSAVGCSSSFPSMQSLMEHTRHHYKPNIFFLCESCRAKLRSYNALLKHLNGCSKVARGKAGRAGEQYPPDVNMDPVSDHTPNPDANLNHNPNPTPDSDSVTSPGIADDGSRVDQETPQQRSDVDPPPVPSQMRPSEDGAVLLNPSSGPFPHPEAQMQAQAQAQAQPQAQQQALAPPHDHTQSPPQAQQQAEPQSLQDVPAPACSPQTSPGSNAVWKKNQGLSCNSRILWEHTRGRYKCVQCGKFTANRPDMTAHIESQHKSTVSCQSTQ